MIKLELNIFFLCSAFAIYAISGGRVIMGCRDMEKCHEAAKEIRGKTLNPHVYACHLDLASMKSIRQFAERIKKGG